MDLSTLLASVGTYGHTPETVEMAKAFQHQILDILDRTAAAGGLLALSTAAGVYSAQEAKDQMKPFYAAMKKTLS